MSSLMCAISREAQFDRAAFLGGQLLVGPGAPPLWRLGCVLDDCSPPAQATLFTRSLDGVTKSDMGSAKNLKFDTVSSRNRLPLSSAGRAQGPVSMFGVGPVIEAE